MKKLRRFLTREITVKADGIDTKEIVINESPMLMMMFRGLNLNIDEVEKIDWMVKVKFENKGQALELKDRILNLDGNIYHYYLSTPSDMKNVKSIFVREDVFPIVKQYESIVSCGWLDNLEGKTNVNINKDITSRLSLFLSSSYHTNIRPNYLVLPEVEYKTIQSIRTFENNELVTKENFEHSSVFADGCGIASPALMRRVSKELKLGYEPCFIGVRSIKLALKGLLVSIDFIKYFNNMYKGDTDTLRKVNGQLEAKDMWGNWIKIDDNTIIVNESMCKWAKKISLGQYKTKRPECLAEIMDALFITKTSKKTPADTSRTSYQLLYQLGLNNQDYSELTKETYELLSGVIAGKKEYVYKFLGAVAEVSDNEIEEVDIEECKIAERLNYLLQVDFEKFYKLPWIKKTLANMVERSVKELCSGKFYIKGDFKTIVNAPLGILNFIINRTDEKVQEINDPLEANEFWCNIRDKEVLASRFPIASFSEVGAMEFIDNDLYSKYCGHWSKELCVFNSRDIRAKILSGADYDTDTIFASSNKLLIYAIIPPKDGLHFIGTEESKGNLGEVVYNWNTRTYANTAYMGNIIGEVAVLNACISNQAQDLGAYVDGENITYKNYFRDCVPTEEQKKEFWGWFWQQERTMNLQREIVKEIVANQFYEVEEAIYKTVEISMVSIDAPKTGILPNLDYIKSLKKNYKKPYYFKLLPNKEIKWYELEYYTTSIIENYAKWSEFSNENWKGILSRVQYYKMDGSWRNGDVFTRLFKIANTLQVNEEAVEEVENILAESFNDYNEQRRLRDDKYEVMAQEYNEERNEWCDIEPKQSLLDQNGKPIRRNSNDPEIRTLMTKTMCFKAERVALHLAENYTDEEVSVALFRLMGKRDNNGLQRYVFDFYFKYVEAMCSMIYTEYETLVESDSEEAIEILFEKYELAKKKLKKTNIGSKELKRFEGKKDIQSQDLQFKFGCSKEVEINLEDYVMLEMTVSGEINVKNKDGVVVGNVYDTITKAGINLYKLIGTKLLIAETKINAKSYTIWIKGIEV